MKPPILTLPKVFRPWLAMTLVLFLCYACDKDDVKPDDNLMAMPATQYPQPSDADAVLIALKSSVPSPVSLPSMPGMPIGDSPVVMDIGLGIALFKDNAKAGKVVLNNTELTFINGVHTWMPDFTKLTDPTAFTGINLNGQIHWQVTDPNIDRTVQTLPGTPKISSDTKINISQGYTLTNQVPGGAQKIIYAIYSSSDKFILKELNGNSNSATFTSAELATLRSTKNGIIQTNAYTISNEIIGGKKVYFVRQSSYTLTGVEIN